MSRFLLTLAAVLAISGLTLAHWHGVALAVGIVLGAAFFLRSMAAGGSLGNARQFGQGQADIGARIGTLLAAAGIASAALGHDPPYPPSFRVMFGLFLLVACVGALVLTGRTLRKPPGGM